MRLRPGIMPDGAARARLAIDGGLQTMRVLFTLINLGCFLSIGDSLRLITGEATLDINKGRKRQ
jgi:hypothetical protein